ncbi:MAG: exodeoxyribonuclease III [Myxococcales bacterium]|nr:exodeoxyribonuclease III [Myxococcales bacterium]
MKVINVNVNGIRSATQKGYFNWQRRQDADVVCLQEIRAQPEQMPDEARAPRRYAAYFFPAVRKGYSGVALYAKRPADRVVTNMGWNELNDEGRYLQADFGPLSVISLYIPSGSSGDERQTQKYRFLAHLREHLDTLRRDGRSYIVTGDWNIAHKNIDLKNWRSNQKNSGFLPEERAWLDRLIDEQGWVDAFRVVNQAAEEYTWWSNRGAAWEKNVGWRLDYQLVTPDLRDSVQSASVYRAKRFSDHAPLSINYDYELNPA